MKHSDNVPGVADVRPSAQVPARASDRVISSTVDQARSAVLAAESVNHAPQATPERASELPVERIPNDGVYRNQATLTSLLNTWSESSVASRRVIFFSPDARPVAKVWFVKDRMVAADFFSGGASLSGDAALLALAEHSSSGRYEGHVPAEPPAGRDDFPGQTGQAVALNTASIVDRRAEDAAAAERKRLKEPPALDLDRSGEYVSRDHFFNVMVQFWAHESSKIDNRKVVGVRRADVYEKGVPLGSLWFSKGSIAAALCLVPNREGEGFHGLCQLLQSLTSGEYAAVCHAVLPGAPYAQGLEEMSWNDLQMSLTGVLGVDEAPKKSAGRSTVTRLADGAFLTPVSVGWRIEVTPQAGTKPAYRVIGMPVDLRLPPESRMFARALCVQVGVPVVQEAVDGPVLFVDPQNDWKTIRSCSLDELFRGDMLSDTSCDSLLMTLRALLRRQMGPDVAPSVPPVSEFSPYGVVPFSVTKAGVVRHGVCDLSGVVLNASGVTVADSAPVHDRLLAPGTVLNHEGGFLWAEFPDGTARYLTGKGKLSERTFTRIVRAGNLPLWMLVKAEVPEFAQPSVESLFPAPLPREIVQEVHVIDARLKSHDFPITGDRAAAVLEAGFWDPRHVPADPTLAELRESLMK